MCGITGGVWTQAGKPLDQATLQRMTDVIRHRGPDEEGVYRSEFANQQAAGQQVAGHQYDGALSGVALGFRRLSIVDVCGSHQPITNEDRSVWLVFNGEIYNYRTLRRRLEGAGHTFRTSGDAETIVHLYEDEGPEFLRHFEGMFALAIWDANRRQLLLARDRLGKKPLVYYHEPERVLFASELKSLLEVPEVPRELDPSAIDEYLTYQYVPHPNTIFRGIRKLPPAHYALFKQNRLSVHCYWQPDFNVERKLKPADYRDQLRTTMTAAVEKRLMSDVPLGAFLSGGIDSSIVVALMQKLKQEPVKTFSIGFPIAAYDEREYARQVAVHLGTDHHVHEVTPDAVAVLPKLVWHYDEPFADSSAIPTYYVSQFTRQHVTVALTGDGGDELFAGYPRYKAVRLAEWFDRMPPAARRVLGSSLWQRLPASTAYKSFSRRLQRFATGIGQPPVQRYLNWIGIFSESARAELYSDDFLARLPDADPAEFLVQALKRADKRDAVTAFSLADLVTYLPCDLMTKVDIASMANSLECRAPFLDHELVELAAAMPIELKYRRQRGKRILLETFGHLLPKSVLHRPKMGFGVPLDHWFRHELADYLRDVLLSQTALDRGYFRPEVVRRMVEEHQANQRDHSNRLWALLVLELWLQTWVDGHGSGPGIAQALGTAVAPG